MGYKLPRCKTGRCDKRSEIQDLCITHAERKADRKFSLWVRARDKKCTAEGLFDIECKGTLQAAHIIGRRRYAVRYDPLNVHALCAAHHYHIDQHGSEDAKYKWAVEVLGSVETWEVLLLNAEYPTTRRIAAEAGLELYP